MKSNSFGLYMDFRPAGGGWGEKTEMRLADILALRRHLTHKPKVEQNPQPVRSTPLATGGPSPSKKVKVEEDKVKKEDEALDEFDAALDDDLDLSSIP